MWGLLLCAPDLLFDSLCGDILSLGLECKEGVLARCEDLIEEGVCFLFCLCLSKCALRFAIPTIGLNVQLGREGAGLTVDGDAGKDRSLAVGFDSCSLGEE